ETRYPCAPLELLEHYHALGARWVHVVDLDGARSGMPGNAALIAQLARHPQVRLQVGGGIGSTAAIEALLQAGVARVGTGSRPVQDAAQVATWLERFGSERLCLAFDVRHAVHGEPHVYTCGWTKSTGLSLWRALAAFPSGTLQHVLATDIERDGALAGPNLPL